MNKKAATASPAIYGKEELLVCTQTISSSRRVLLCGRCCRPAAGARHHLALALGRSRSELRSGVTLPDLPDLREPASALPNNHDASIISRPFWCQHNGGPSRRACDEVYCSNGCRDAAATAHALVCCQGLSTGAPLLEFDKLTSVAGAEHFRVASRLLAAEAAAALNVGPDLAAISASAQESAARLEALCDSEIAGLTTITSSEVINSTLNAPSRDDDLEEDDEDIEKLAAAARTEEADALEAGGLLHVGILAQLDSSIRASPLGTRLVAPQLFVRLVGMLRRRLVSLHMPSPLQAYCTQLAQAHARDASTAATIGLIETPPSDAFQNVSELLSVQKRSLELLLPAAARAVDLSTVDGNEGDLQSQLNALLCAEAYGAALEAVNGAAPMGDALESTAETANYRAGVDCDPTVVRRGHLLAQCAPWLFPPADLQALAPGLFFNSSGTAVLHSCVPTAQLQFTADDLEIREPRKWMDSSSKNHEDSICTPPLLRASLVAVRVDAAAALHAADAEDTATTRVDNASVRHLSIPSATVSWADFEPRSTVRERQQALRRKLGHNASVLCRCERCLHETEKSSVTDSNDIMLGSSGSNNDSNNLSTMVIQRHLMVLARDAIEGGRFEDAVTLLRMRLRNKTSLNGCNSTGTTDGDREVTTVEEEGTPWVLLGLSLLNLGLWSDARRVWARGVALHPTHPLLMLQRQKDITYNQDDDSVKKNEVVNDSSIVGGATPCETYALGKELGAPKCVVTLQPLLSRESCTFAVNAAEDFAAGTSLADANASTKLRTDSPSSSSSSTGWTTSRHYSVPTTDLPVHGVPLLVPWFADLMTNSVAPLLEKHFGNQADSTAKNHEGNGNSQSTNGGFSNSSFVAEQVRVHDAFVVRYSAAPGQACHLPLHCDESTLSFTLSLNSGHGDEENCGSNFARNGVESSRSIESSNRCHLPQYSGGGTYFAALRRALRPKLGCCALFDGRALHGGEPTTAGTRYILAAFLYIDTKTPRHLKQKRVRHLELLGETLEDTNEGDNEEREPWDEVEVRQDTQHIKRPRFFESISEVAKEGGFSFGFSFL